MDCAIPRSTKVNQRNIRLAVIRIGSIVVEDDKKSSLMSMWKILLISKDILQVPRDTCHSVEEGLAHTLRKSSMLDAKP